MKTNDFLLALSILLFSFAQYDYEPSPNHTFGAPNPETPKNTARLYTLNRRMRL